MTNVEEISPYVLVFEHRPHYLYANVEGEFDNYTISTSYWNEIAKELKRTGYNKLLVYEELRSNASRADAFQSVCSVCTKDFGGVQIAFVDRYPDHAGVNGLALQAARNKGFNLENFSSLEDAERWLVPFDLAA